MELQPTYTIFACVHCGAESKLYLQDHTCFYGCPKCRHFSVRKGPDEWDKKKPLIKISNRYFLPLHAKGKIDGQAYTIVARLSGRDQEGYTWREYWAWNPRKGYLYLSEFNGHWVCLEELDEDHSKGFAKMEFYHRTQVYRKYAQYRFKYIDIEGELPFEPDAGSFAAGSEEFIAPPYCMVRERDADEWAYYSGRHVSLREIKEWFPVTGYPDTALKSVPDPDKTGVGMVEPYLGFMQLNDAIKLSLLAALVLIVSGIFYSAVAPNKTVYEAMHVEGQSDTLVSEVVTLDRKQNLQFDLESSLFNNWAGASIELVNIETGDVTSVYGETEYYSGYEGGEHWTEGSQSTCFMLSSVPAGRYRFEVLMYHGAPGYAYISLRVKSGTVIVRNFFIVLAVLAIVPGLLALLGRRFEVSRWSNSNYSPYEEE